MRQAPGAPAAGSGGAFRTGLMAFLVVVVLALSQTGLHTVPEGHVGVYYRGGALQNYITDPGFHWKVPVLDSVEFVQTTTQTDSVTNVPCGTSGGVMVEFAKIEVVNRLRKSHVLATVKEYSPDYDKPLIFDRIHHEMNQFCSQSTLTEVYITKFGTLDDLLLQALQSNCDKYETGIEILSVRITKPRLSPSIAKSYEDMENQKSQLLIAVERQKVVEREAETDRQKARIEAEKIAEVSRINMEKEIAEKEARRKIAEIEDTIQLAKEKHRADARYYTALKEAEANRLQLTKEYLTLEMIRAVANNTKVYFGDRLPNMFFDTQSSHSLLDSMPTAEAALKRVLAARAASISDDDASDE